MSRDEHLQYTPNVTLTSFGTPSFSSQPLWTTPNANPGTPGPFIMGTGFQTYGTYPAYLATPGLGTTKHQLSAVINEKATKIWAVTCSCQTDNNKERVLRKSFI